MIWFIAYYIFSCGMTLFLVWRDQGELTVGDLILVAAIGWMMWVPLVISYHRSLDTFMYKTFGIVVIKRKGGGE